MIDKVMSRRAIVAGMACSAVVPSLARAQAAYPGGQAVKMIVPFAPGGATDVIGRMIGERLSSAWGSPLVIENIGGAGANIGIDRVAKSAPDGMTLLFTSPAIATNQFLYPSLPYDPERDLVPVSLSAVAPALLMSRNSLEARTMPELLAYARANPGKLTYGHNGAGTATHMTGELFKRMAGVDMRGVPYRSGALAMNDTIAGNIDLLFDNISSSLPQVQAGTVRCLGITSPKRHAPAPDLVPIADSVPGFEAEAWFGVMARAGTPAAIIARVEADAVAAGQDAGLRDRLAKIATALVGSTTTEFATLIADERKRWGKLIHELGIKLD